MPTENMPSDQVSIMVLGIMQDAGLPHIGCRCRRCVQAQADPDQADFAASLAIVDDRGPQPAVWLIDATPDIPRQLFMLADLLTSDSSDTGQLDRLRRPDGLFLTHAHMGHTVGLAQLGPEGMAAAGLPVYGPAGLIDALGATQLWRPLVESLALQPLPPGQPLQLGADLQVTPLAVPHRDELQAGTFAYLIQGPDKQLLYLPDIDDWDQWPAAGQYMTTVDIALVDATFFGPAELGGRPPVAHPLVTDTLARWTSQWAGRKRQLILTHLNHTNPVLDEDSPERRAVLAAGAAVAQTGQIIAL